eukprot:133801-Prorocentrum_minimum.AAC.1
MCTEEKEGLWGVECTLAVIGTEEDPRTRKKKIICAPKENYVSTVPRSVLEVVTESVVLYTQAEAEMSVEELMAKYRKMAEENGVEGSEEDEDEEMASAEEEGEEEEEEEEA